GKLTPQNLAKPIVLDHDLISPCRSALTALSADGQSHRPPRLRSPKKAPAKAEALIPIELS
ncbi:MAG: hypothetical protein ACRC1L_14780, partial [Prochlorococcaceae cyanobacterium]